MPTPTPRAGDLFTNESYPGVVFGPTAPEVGGIWCEDRENSGTLYRVTNAVFDGSQWNKVASSAAYAVAMNSADGSISFLQSPNHASWTAWVGNAPRAIANVKDFGAKGDGISLDSPAFDAAIAALPAAGGVVYVPPGTYVIDKAISLGDNTVLLGAGFECTTIKLQSGAYGSGGHTWMIINQGAGGAGGTIISTQVYIVGLTIDGNAANQNFPDAKGLITLDGVSFCGVSDCYVMNSRGDGIQVSLLGNPTMSNPWPGGIVNYFILRNRININAVPGSPTNYVSGYAIRCLGASNGLISENIIGDVADYSNGGGTNDSIGPPGCSNMVISNNSIFNGGDGINLMACYDAVISGNLINGSGGYGISTFADTWNLGVSRITIVGNTIESVMKTGIRVSDGTGDASGHAHDFVVANNTLSGSTMTPDAIHIEASYGTVTGNVVNLGGGANDGIAVDGNACVCTGNQIYNGTGHAINTGKSSPVSNNLIADNSVIGVSAPLNTTLTNLSHCIIRNNMGINPVGATIITQPSLPTAGAIVSNQFPFDCMVYVTGATGVTVDGLAIGLSGSISVRLKVGSFIEFASIPSSWVWIPE